MSATPTSTFSFTKLVVDDLEKMAGFYCEAFGLKQVDRIQGDVGDDAIDEIVLGPGDSMTGGVILLKYLDKPKPENGEVILGIMTDDVEALYLQVQAAGGGIYAPVKHREGSAFKVGFVVDPEGHLSEIVQMLE